MAASSSNEWRIVERNSERRLVRSDIVLGIGSFKEVYMGFDELNGIEIAWSKIEFTSEIKRSNRCAEAELLMLLKHENITKCYQHWLDRDNKIVNMITEYCSSGNLRDYIWEHNLLGNTVMIKNWCRQILNALHYLHTRDIPVCHLDVKCVNIFVNGNTGTIKLGDFGIAKKYEEPGSKPALMTDISRFGVTVAEMANKKLLFGAVYLGGMAHGGAPGFQTHPIGHDTSVLTGVKNDEIARFSYKCIAPTSQTTAMKLLGDSFLAVDVTETSTASTSAAGNLNLRETVRDQVARLLLPPTEVLKEFDSGDKKFRLQGKMSDNVSISITLRIIMEGKDMVRTINFEFLLGVDTIPDIMENIEVEFDSSAEVALVSENMEQLITECQHKPHDGNTPSIAEHLFSQEQQTQDGRSEDNRRRGNRKWKLSSWLCCKKN